MCAKTKKDNQVTKSVREIKNQQPMQELGIANAWKQIPNELTECREKGHLVNSKTISRCYHEYTCNICNYRYSVDSSD